MVSILAGCTLSEHSAHQSCDRFHGGVYRAICLWSLRRAFADAASGICARCVCALSHHLREPVPMVLKNLERGLRAKFDELKPRKRWMLDRLMGLNKMLTRPRPRVEISRRLLPQVHKAFGGELRALIVGGAFTDPSTLQFFYDLGIPVACGYGLTEACTAVTLNDLKPFRADTVGKPLPGSEVRVLNPDSDGIGEVAVRSRAVMSHYLDDPEQTAQTIVEGWLLTGDQGRFEEHGHLQLFGRKKNMIVTEGGKNVYPED